MRTSVRRRPLLIVVVILVVVVFVGIARCRTLIWQLRCVVMLRSSDEDTVRAAADYLGNTKCLWGIPHLISSLDRRWEPAEMIKYFGVLQRNELQVGEEIDPCYDAVVCMDGSARPKLREVLNSGSTRKAMGGVVTGERRSASGDVWRFRAYCGRSDRTRGSESHVSLCSGGNGIRGLRAIE